MRFFFPLFILFYLFHSYGQGYWQRVHGDGISEFPSEIGTYAPENSPHGNYGLGCTVDSSGSFWLYFETSLWRYNPSINEWMVSYEGEFDTDFGELGVPSPTNNPGLVEFGHPTWGDHLGNLWMHGLNASDNLWKYEISSGLWTWISGSGLFSSPAVYGVKGVPAPTNSPGICNETDCHWVDSDGILWLFTEFNGNLWTFDPATEWWTWMAGDGAAGLAAVYGTIDEFDEANTPGSFSACPSVGNLYSMWLTSDDHLWMLVNRFEAELNTEVWEFDPVLNEWRCRRIDVTEFGADQIYPAACTEGDSSIYPVARSEMRAEWVDACDNVYFFGGLRYCDFEGAYNDIWKYDPILNTYTYIRGGADPLTPGIQGVFDAANSPATLAGGQAWENENGFYYMGGQNGGDSPYNDHLWLYVPDTVVADFSLEVDCITATFTNLSTSGCNTIKDIHWDFGDGTSSTLENPSHDYLENGIYEVVLSVTNCSWHTDTVVYSIVVDCGFSIGLDPDTICVGDCVELIATSVENTDSIDFVWDNDILENNDSIVVCPLETNTYTVIGTHVSGEIDTAIVTIIVEEIPTVYLGADTVLCGGIIILDAANPGLSYSWQDGSVEQFYTVESTGTYWVSVSNSACSVSDSINVVVNGPHVDLGPDTTVCTIVDFILDAGSTGSETYVWQDLSIEQTFNIIDTGFYFVTVTDTNGCERTDSIYIAVGEVEISLGDDIVLCSSEEVILNAESGVTANYEWQDGSSESTFTATSEGEYIVVVTDGACSGTDSIEVYLDNPIAQFSISDTIGCSPLEVSFTDLSIADNPIVSWEWNFGDGVSSTLQHPNHYYELSGTYTVTLQITTETGCVSDTLRSIVVEVYDYPIAAFTFDPEFPNVGTAVQFTNESVNAESWNWEFGDGAEASIENPIHTYSTLNNYTVTLTVGNHGCLDSISKSIIIDEELIFYVPNAFTPNGDDFNNDFSPVFTSGFDPYDYHLTIFNRWGEIVFESYNSSIGWNGSYPHCGIVQDGVYVWQIELGLNGVDERKVYRGHVTLLK